MARINKILFMCYYYFLTFLLFIDILLKGFY